MAWNDNQSSSRDGTIKTGPSGSIYSIYRGRGLKLQIREYRGSSLSATINLVDGVFERISQMRSSLMQEPPSASEGKVPQRSGMAGALEAMNDKLRMTHSHLDSLERYLNT